MKKYSALFFLPCLAFAGCKGVDWPTVGAAILDAADQGLVGAPDAKAAYEAIKQSDAAKGKLDFAKVLSIALQIRGAIQASPALSTAVHAAITDAKNIVTAVKTANPNATDAQINSAVAANADATVKSVDAIAPNPSTTLIIKHDWQGKTYFVRYDNQTVTTKG